MNVRVDRARSPAGWVRFAEMAGVCADALGHARSDRAKAIVVGKFLSGKVGREIPVKVSGRQARAVLKVIEGRARERRYYFEVVFETDDADGAGSGKRRQKGPATDSNATSRGQRASSTRRKPAANGNSEDW
jgi:hypothetical protein